MTKHDLRKHFKERRRALTALEVAEQSDAIAQRFFDFFDVGQITTIHSFLPISQQNEVNTLAILDRVHSQYTHTQIAVPRVIVNTNRLEHHLWKPDTQLTYNQWNIPEPVIGSFLSDFQLVLVPLLAYDQSGHRVGYGKGYYDRFLTQCSPDTLKVGLSFFEPIQLIEDTNPHDIRLDYCITPTKIWKFS